MLLNVLLFQLSQSSQPLQSLLLAFSTGDFRLWLLKIVQPLTDEIDFIANLDPPFLQLLPHKHHSDIVEHHAQE
jgi:hypothetical protein